VRVLTALLVLSLLTACRERDLPAEAADDRAAIAEDRARRVALAEDEQQLVAALALTRAVARDATKVELFVIGNEYDADFAAIQGNEKAAGYPIRRKVAVSAAVAAPLIETLTDRSTYFEPGNGWTCIFEPHHVLRVQSDGQTVNVVICLECGDVSFVAQEKQLILKSVRPDPNRRLASVIEEIVN
jgi:hypothetical protein